MTVTTAETAQAISAVESALRKSGGSSSYHELLEHLGRPKSDPAIARALHELVRRRDVLALGGGIYKLKGAGA